MGCGTSATAAAQWGAVPDGPLGACPGHPGYHPLRFPRGSLQGVLGTRDTLMRQPQKGVDVPYARKSDKEHDAPTKLAEGLRYGPTGRRAPTGRPGAHGDSRMVTHRRGFRHTATRVGLCGLRRR